MSVDETVYRRMKDAGFTHQAALALADTGNALFQGSRLGSGSSEQWISGEGPPGQLPDQEQALLLPDDGRFQDWRCSQYGTWFYMRPILVSWSMASPRVGLTTALPSPAGYSYPTGYTTVNLTLLDLAHDHLISNSDLVTGFVLGTWTNDPLYGTGVTYPVAELTGPGSGRVVFQSYSDWPGATSQDRIDMGPPVLAVGGPKDYIGPDFTTSYDTEPWVGYEPEVLDPADYEIGEDGQFYIDTVNRLMYGPRINGEWGEPLNADVTLAQAVSDLQAQYAALAQSISYVSPNGTAYRIVVGDDGSITTEPA